MSELTDPELNEGIARCLGIYYCDDDESPGGVVVNDGWSEVNYCSNWDDLMPLVIEHLTLSDITLCFSKDNPKRELVCKLFLKLINENNNEKTEQG